ncbi:MAG: amidase [Xanthomonadales bacterium]|nr:amidase [Gammaproteobacteria bacterium]MBT8055005.1 amidase [Gammaproteobacteria bacterium]NND56387.1 amidase [Xanthomonadales bacterium]NNK50444.1 amidase [Xanthomonadales bacterium]
MNSTVSNLFSLLCFALVIGLCGGPALADEGPSQQLAQTTLTRIEQWNDQIKAVISVHPGLMNHAAQLDRERRSGEIRGALHGVPILIKDNIESNGLPTTAGSLALAGNETGRDAFLVEHLRNSGLLVVGKANLSEWANFRSERSSSGWSGVGGQARNPYDINRSPCGSSSGSAVAVAAGMVPLAVGTETNGSIICPSAANGIVGIKPTVGLVSRRGIVPISHTQDTAGPMAANVRDAAFLLNAMTVFDPLDSASPKNQLVFERDYTTALKSKGLQGKRIGVVRSLTGFHEGVDERFSQAVADLAEAGAEIVDDLSLPQYPDGFQAAAYDVLLFEFKHDLNGYLADLPGAASALTLEKLIEFNRQYADTELRWFQQEVFVKSQAKDGLESADYQKAVEWVQSFSRAGIDDLLKEHGLDLLVSPSNGPAWSIDLVTGDKFLGGSSSFPARAGYPHITVPMGFVHGLPVGLSFYGAALSELVLIEAAYGYEQATRHARPPADFGPWLPAVSEYAWNQDSPVGGVISKVLAVPTMVGNGARCEVAESEEGESGACQ